MGPGLGATTDWQESARHALLALREGEAGWGYRSGTSPSVEPSALAGLALIATTTAAEKSSSRATADWLKAVQQPDGALGVSEQLATPGWTTAYALLLWQALGGYDAQRRNAAAWLLGQKGATLPAETGPDCVLGHDTTLVGWPWVNGTHSWVEPTAMAVLALRREGFSAHPRVREGVRVIADRAIDTGGWNCGNKSAFGRNLRPQPGPTGLALLALAPERERTAVVAKALHYLNGHLPGVRAPESLGWGVLGLRAWGESPSNAADWLAESYRQTVGRPDAAPRLALLLLAAGENTLEFFDGGTSGSRDG